MFLAAELIFERGTRTRFALLILVKNFMKIYFEPADLSTKIDEDIDRIIKGLPNGEIADLFKKLLSMFSTAQDELNVKNMELIKYRTMWALRFIEDEFNSAGGTLILDITGKSKCTGFSPDMVSKINNELVKNYK